MLETIELPVTVGYILVVDFNIELFLSDQLFVIDLIRGWACSLL